jgi:predicted dehydrogenase
MSALSTSGSAPLRVAVIGTRFGGQVQVPGFRLLDEVRVVAVASARRERAEHVAAQYDIPQAFDDYRAMLDSVEVDLVSIVTPPYLHHEMVLEAAARGLHVVCEKPLALDAAEAADMLGAMDSRGLVHAVDHEFRYFRGLAAFKAEVDRGALGEARMARVVWRSDSQATTQRPGYTWWSEGERGGGVLGAIASHWVDALRWWFGEPHDVASQVATFVPLRRDAAGVERPVTSEDTAGLVMRLGPTGTLGSIDVSVAVGPPGWRVEAYGTEGALILDGSDSLRFECAGHAPQEVALAPARFPSADHQSPNVAAFATLITDVCAAIRGEAPTPFPTFADGLAVQRVLDAARNRS